MIMKKFLAQSALSVGHSWSKQRNPFPARNQTLSDLRECIIRLRCRHNQLLCNQKHFVYTFIK